MTTAQVDVPLASDDSSRRRPRGEGGHTTPDACARRETAQSRGGRASAVGIADAGELFTDLELMEDSRAIDFSVRSFAGAGVGAGATGRTNRGRHHGVPSSSGCGGNAGGAATGSSRSCGSRPGHYYDWVLSKLEGKEAGIIRGDTDVRGKRMPQQPGGKGGSGGRGSSMGDGATGDGGGLQRATLEELLDLVRDMVEELDVPDDHLAKERHTQGERA